MFLIAQPNLLYFLIRTLETRNALMVNPNPHWWFGSFLNSNNPIFMRIHGHNIICMSLHKHLFSCVNVFPYKDASCRIIHFVIFEDEVRVMERAEWKSCVELQERIWRKYSNDAVIWFSYWWNILTSFLLIGCDLWPLHYGIRKLFRRLNLRFLQFPSNLSWINFSRHIDKIIIVFPSTSFYNFECKLFRKTIPVINIGTSIDTPNN